MVIGYPIRLIVGLLLIAALVGVVPAVISGAFDQAMALAARAAVAFR
jgi:flagellar biosynthesis protein FliR